MVFADANREMSCPNPTEGCSRKSTPIVQTGRPWRLNCTAMCVNSCTVKNARANLEGDGHSRRSMAKQQLAQTAWGAVPAITVKPLNGGFPFFFGYDGCQSELCSVA